MLKSQKQVQFIIDSAGNKVTLKPIEKEDAQNAKDDTNTDKSLENQKKELFALLDEMYSNHDSTNFTPLLKAKKITKTYKQGKKTVTIIKELSLTINPSDFVVLLGPSGSGKTTLLRILAGLTFFDGGEIELCGERITPTSYDERRLAQLRRSRVGLITQQWNLYPRATILENFYLRFSIKNAKNKFSGEKKTLNKFIELLRHMKLKYNLNRMVEHLSLGEQQRLAMVLALIKKPDIILADEPTANVDAQSSQYIVELLHRVSQNGIAVVMATHDVTILNPDMKVFYLGKKP